jgi:predicted DNA binding CopG/RHH family protein
MKDRKDEFLIIRVPKALKEKLQKQADKKGIKLSRLVREVLDGKK